MIDLAILIAAVGFFIMTVCVGVALIMRSRRPRLVRDPAPPVVKERVTLEDRLEEIRKHRFSVQQQPSQATLDVLREPTDYKGPFRRTPNVRRKSSERRYYDRRQDPEMFGRRGTADTGSRKQEKEDDSTTE